MEIFHITLLVTDHPTYQQYYVTHWLFVSIPSDHPWDITQGDFNKHLMVSCHTYWSHPNLDANLLRICLPQDLLGSNQSLRNLYKVDQIHFWMENHGNIEESRTQLYIVIHCLHYLWEVNLHVSSSSVPKKKSLDNKALDFLPCYELLSLY